MARTNTSGMNNRERFLTLAPNRVISTLTGLVRLGKLGDVSKHEYTPDDVEHIFSTIREQLLLAEKEFNFSRKVEENVHFQLREV